MKLKSTEIIMNEIKESGEKGEKGESRLNSSRRRERAWDGERNNA